MDYFVTLKHNLENRVYFHNSLYDYITAVLIFLFIIISLTIFIKIIVKRIKIEDNIDNPFLASLIEIFRKRTVYVTYAFAVYGLLSYLKTPQIINTYIDRVVMIYVVLILIISFIEFLTSYNHIAAARKDEKVIPAGIITILKASVWVAGILFIFSNLGYNVSTFMAGLGIGGIAVALAAQNILGDLFNYLVILFDKPFAKGDLIEFNTLVGRVENVGIKSTKIRSSNGEMLSVSNTDLTKTTIHNYELAEKRRNVSIIGVEYETELDKVHQIPYLLENAVKSVKGTEFSRVHFSAFNSSSLDFELVYFILTSDYGEYVSGIQKVNFAILDIFTQQGINFAYPTQRMIKK